MTTPLLGLNEIVAGVGGDSPSVASNKIILNFQILDAHDHTTGNGAAITTGALNIDANLSFGNNAAVDLSRSSFQNLSTAPTVNQSLYVLDGDLIYRNSLGQVIPVTVGNSLGSPSGSIGGLAAPASATFSPSTDTFSFFHDGALKGVLSSSNIIMQQFTASGGSQPAESVTLAVPTLDSSHTITWPTASPAANNYYMRFTSSGAATYVPGFESDSSSPVTANQVVYATSTSELTGLTVSADNLILGTAGAPSAGKLTNAFVDASAAIEGTKISPNFGSQNLATTGTASTGALSATSLASSDTLTVTNTATFNGSVAITDADDTFTSAAPASFTSSLGVSGATTLTTLSTSGTTSLAATSISSVTSSLTPSVDSTYSLGSNATRWSNMWSDTLTTTTANVQGNLFLSGGIRVTGVSLDIRANTLPFTDNFFTLGGPINRWSEVYATGGNFNGTIRVSQNNATGGGIVLADDGDIVDLNDGFCSMRFSRGVRIYDANASGALAIQLGADGGISTGDESIKWRVFEGSTSAGATTVFTVPNTIYSASGVYFEAGSPNTTRVISEAAGAGLVGFEGNSSPKDIRIRNNSGQNISFRIMIAYRP